MTRTGIPTGLARMVNLRDVMTPSGAFALVVPGAQVVAPFADLRSMANYAHRHGITIPGYRALPFLDLGMIASL
ncbi:hypothetical protein ThrDRAFT_03566 [Frankia casuarinae]|nr:hypothetical protein CcI6DRAFT_04119 [Frankia sp. CcI6]EYT90788.1 hypothetical protein ThrDRAFT_03566 [Frankia casuarinae]KFB03777.1 hypothetical protein ALLO2DRAFT_03448 [Frankia sp. Allo2]OHV51237.1 hypothetical protein CgIS1_19115 [Frankia sp. CgIS1]ORT46747.1 hypothetical protein KBI5_23505 [Frankia sp. KB5]